MRREAMGACRSPRFPRKANNKALHYLARCVCCCWPLHHVHCPPSVGVRMVTSMPPGCPGVRTQAHCGTGGGGCTPEGSHSARAIVAEQGSSSLESRCSTSSTGGADPTVIHRPAKPLSCKTTAYKCILTCKDMHASGRSKRRVALALPQCPGEGCIGMASRLASQSGRTCMCLVHVWNATLHWQYLPVK